MHFKYRNKRLLIIILIVFLVVTLLQYSFLNLLEHVYVYGKESLLIDAFTQKAPFDGHGLNKPSDAFAPYEQVILYANVTYSGNPLSGVLVIFKIQCPAETNYTFYLEGRTNKTGIACRRFSMPPNNLSENEIIGTWTVESFVEYSNKEAKDILTFKVDWIIKILSVKTVNSSGKPQHSFGIDGDVGAEVTLRNIAKTFKETFLFVGFFDELNRVTGEEFLLNIQPNGEIVKLFFKLHIAKSSVPGNATLYACAITPEGTAYCPQISSNFTINIIKPSEIKIHDLSIVTLELSKNNVKQGETLEGFLTVRNEGTEMENFSICLRCNSTLIETIEVRNLEPYAEKIIKLNLDTSNLTIGKYLISAEIFPLPDEAEIEDNLKTQKFSVYKPYYDLAIINVSSEKKLAEIGETVPIHVSLENNGTEKESFYVNIYANSSLIGKIYVHNLKPKEVITVTFYWNTSNWNAGLYLLEANIPPLPEEEDVLDNYFTDGTVELKLPPRYFHDVAVKSVCADKYRVVIGEVVKITVYIKNEGNYTESFRVYIYSNETLLGNQTIENLPSNMEKVLTFTWNTSGFKEGKYIIKAYIPELPGEKDIEDNTYIDGTVLVLSPTPPFAWNLFIILLIIILLLVLSIVIFTLRKRKKKKSEREHLTAMVLVAS